jgi:uncharacterized protein DUF4430
VRRLAPVALAALLAAGCGAGQKGQASLWVTRDRGARVLLVESVPAGLTAMQALQRVADVKTRYGGRFVQSINGIAGNVTAQRDWFYFVNGYEADRGAAEYRLRPGDVEWWDFRSWAAAGGEHVPVVVGAFPEPFVHGYGGKRRQAVVFGAPSAGRALARVVHGTYRGRFGTAPPGANTLRVGPGVTRFTGQASTAGGPVTFVFHGNWRALAGGKFRYRYEVR